MIDHHTEGGSLTAVDEELVRAWNAWENEPGRLQTALRMETACQVVADELGITSNELRSELAAARRVGNGPETSLRLVREAHS